jgi:predicted RNA binding protein YcfA (HicA-like mRNA interferase family)
MKLPRDLSGVELIKLLCKHHDYRKVNQEGSHVILETESPRHHRLAVPDHNPLRIGTLNAILRAVAEVKGLTKEEVLKPRS